MATTSYATTNQERRHWHRLELTAWSIVAAVSVAAFTVLILFVHVRPLVAFLGIVVALDLPFCIDLIWRAGRVDSTAATPTETLSSVHEQRP